MEQMAMGAMDKIGGNQSSSKALQKVQEAMQLAHKLVLSVLPQVSAMNPKISKDLHALAVKLQALVLEVQKEQPPSAPPEMLMAMAGGESGGPLGSPPNLGGGPQGF